MRYLSRLSTSLLLGGAIAVPGFAQVPPGAIEITCNADRRAFRLEVKFESDVTFRFWTAETGGSQCGPDYVVPLDQLRVLKQKSDKFADRKPIKFSSITAAVGSDGSPAQLCAGQETWVDLTVGTTTLTCAYDEDDNARQPPPPPARRRLQSVAFANSTQPSAIAAVATSQAIELSDGTETIIPFVDEVFDTAAIHDNVTNNTRLTAPEAGTYIVTALIQFESDPNGNRALRFLINGGGNAGSTIVPAAQGGLTADTSGVVLSNIVSLAANDYVELEATQDSGSALDVFVDGTFGMVKIH